jgi:multiple sugar transport system ATP-binding protein
MAAITLQKINKTYGGNVVAVADVDLEIRDGEFMVLLGPSGCGKSTTLRMIAGLEEITSGDLHIGGKRMNEVDPAQRDLAIVFQNYALYPHMTVAGNLAFGLKLRGVPKSDIEARMKRTADMLGIGQLLHRRPRELSGGQQQRVALGRALVREPQAFLLDEPLSNLDAKLRASMRTELVKLHRQLGTTIVHVTHDQVEAMTMGERICIMRDGKVVQVGAPLEVYRNPADTFVAGFLASPPMNLMGTVLTENNGRLMLNLKGLTIPLPDAYVSTYGGWRDEAVVFGLRPEDIYAAPGPGREPVDVKVVAVEALGPEIILVGEMPGGEVSGRMGRVFSAAPGSTQRVYFDMTQMHLFNAVTTKVIPR